MKKPGGEGRGGKGKLPIRRPSGRYVSRTRSTRPIPPSILDHFCMNRVVDRRNPFPDTKCLDLEMVGACRNYGFQKSRIQKPFQGSLAL